MAAGHIRARGEPSSIVENFPRVIEPLGSHTKRRGLQWATTFFPVILVRPDRWKVLQT